MIKPQTTMNKIKNIPRPELPGAVRLTAIQLNALHFQEKRTLLTPAQLEKLAASSPAK